MRSRDEASSKGDLRDIMRLLELRLFLHANRDQRACKSLEKVAPISFRPQPDADYPFI